MFLESCCMFHETQIILSSYKKNICRLFHILEQLTLTTSESKPDCYHQKVNIRVAIVLFIHY